MDPSIVVEYIVLISVIIVLIHTFKYLYLDLFIYGFQMPILGTESIFFYQPISSLIRTIFSFLVTITTLPLIFIIIFYLISYGIYLLLLWLLDQGWLFFLHPIIRPILDLPPFKQLIKFGVFKLIKGIFSAFGVSTIIGAFFRGYLSVYVFSIENTRYIFNLIAPNLGNKFIEYMERNKSKKSEEIQNELKEEEIKKEELKQEEDNKPKAQIETAVKSLIANKIKNITPDLDATEKNNIFVSNNNEIINAYSKKVGDYIKLNY